MNRRESQPGRVADRRWPPVEWVLVGAVILTGLVPGVVAVRRSLEPASAHRGHSAAPVAVLAP